MVAHLQFSLKYPLLLSSLSMLCLGLVAIPISEIKFSKLFNHLSQMVMPFKKYLSASFLPGVKQRCFIACQQLYSCVLLMLCVILASRTLQPQLLLIPERSFEPVAVVIFPHEQRHSQTEAFCFLSTGNFLTTVKNPNTCPVISGVNLFMITKDNVQQTGYKINDSV